MPTVSKEVNIDIWEDVEVDIDVEEYFDEMDDEEKREMAILLRQEGLIGVDSRGFDGWEFQKALRKLAANYHSLSNEDIAPILQLAKRF